MEHVGSASISRHGAKSYQRGSGARGFYVLSGWVSGLWVPRFWHKKATNTPHTHQHETISCFRLHFFLMRSMSSLYHLSTRSSDRCRAAFEGRCNDQPAFFNSRPICAGSYFNPNNPSSTKPTRPRVHTSPSKPCAAQPLFSSSTNCRNSLSPILPLLPPTGMVLYHLALLASYRDIQRERVDLPIPKLSMMLFRLWPFWYNSTARCRIPSYETESRRFFITKMKQRYEICSCKNARGYKSSSLIVRGFLIIY